MRPTSSSAALPAPERSSVVGDVNEGLDATACARNTDEGSDGLRGPSAPADDAAHVLWRDMQSKYRRASPALALHDHGVRFVGHGTREVGEHFDRHVAPTRLLPAALRFARPGGNRVHVAGLVAGSDRVHVARLVLRSRATGTGVAVPSTRVVFGVESVGTVEVLVVVLIEVVVLVIEVFVLVLVEVLFFVFVVELVLVEVLVVLAGFDVVVGAVRSHQASDSGSAVAAGFSVSPASASGALAVSGSVSAASVAAEGAADAAGAGSPPAKRSKVPELRSRRSTRSVGLAPSRNHRIAFSWSMVTMAALSVVERPRGAYVPTTSRKRPSRGDRLSAATTR